MRFKVVFRDGAQDEAVAAARYIAEQGLPETAAKWFESLEQTVASLSAMPRRFGHARESHKFPDIELRQIVFKSHRLIFMIRDREVHVLHIRHVARADLESL